MSSGNTNMQESDSSSSQSYRQPQIMPQTLRQTPQDGLNDHVLEVLMTALIYANPEVNNGSGSTTTGTTPLVIRISVGGNYSIDPLLTDHDKKGLLPASKEAIDTMPRKTVKQAGNDCAICLDEIGVGCDVREMPCKHGFHSGCLEKWLGIHGSCPVCRFIMPLATERSRVVDPGQLNYSVKLKLF